MYAIRSYYEGLEHLVADRGPLQKVAGRFDGLGQGSFEGLWIPRASQAMGRQALERRARVEMGELIGGLASYNFV